MIRYLSLSRPTRVSGDSSLVRGSLGNALRYDK